MRQYCSADSASMCSNLDLKSPPVATKYLDLCTALLAFGNEKQMISRSLKPYYVSSQLSGPTFDHLAKQLQTANSSHRPPQGGHKRRPGNKAERRCRGRRRVEKLWPSSPASWRLISHYRTAGKQPFHLLVDRRSGDTKRCGEVMNSGRRAPRQEPDDPHCGEAQCRLHAGPQSFFACLRCHGDVSTLRHASRCPWG